MELLLTQSVTALSSGEAEYYGTVKGASQWLGLQALMKCMGAINKRELESGCEDGEQYCHVGWAGEGKTH